jgi:hypothetical protein
MIRSHLAARGLNTRVVRLMTRHVLPAILLLAMSGIAQAQDERRPGIPDACRLMPQSGAGV